MLKCRFEKISKFFFTIVFCFVLTWYLMNQKLDKLSNHQKDETDLNRSSNFYSAFQEILLKQADANRTIVLSVFDTSFADMAYNLYASSFAKFNITNYLFVGADHLACQQLNAYHKEAGSVACATRFYDLDGTTPSIFESKEFWRKMCYKMTSILDALNLGLSVLIVDVDIVFIRNPLPVFAKCSSCDLQIQACGRVHPGNSGFYFTQPTKVAIRLLQQSLTVQKKQRVSEQQAFNNVLHKFYREKPRSIRAQYLDKYLYADGPGFYENNMITYTDHVAKCKNCVMVHNNWIKGKEAKVYRFKETGMWHVDWDQRIMKKKVALVEGYYSNPKGLYLAYENTQDFGPEETLQRETNALKTALYIGYFLNRIVILPAFHCYGCAYETPADKICSKHNRCFNRHGCKKFVSDRNSSKTKYNETDFSFERTKDLANRCSFNTHFHIAQFNSQFVYREHVFLQNPKVPDIIKQGQSPPVFIVPLELQTCIKKNVSVDNIFSPSNFTTGATRSEIRSWFSSYRHWPVLRFHSLYSVIPDRTFSSNASSGDNPFIFARIRAAFAASTYRQST